MSKVQYVIEHVDQADFYWVELAMNNAIQSFCKSSSCDNNLIKEYTKLLSNHKMDLELEQKISKQLEPYFEKYILAYSKFLLPQIQESDSAFELKTYREIVGVNNLYNIFEQDNDQIISNAIGSLLDPDNIRKVSDVINKILLNTNLSLDQILQWVKSIIQSANDKNSAVSYIITVSADPEKVEQLINNQSNNLNADNDFDNDINNNNGIWKS